MKELPKKMNKVIEPLYNNNNNKISWAINSIGYRSSRTIADVLSIITHKISETLDRKKTPGSYRPRYFKGL